MYYVSFNCTVKVFATNTTLSTAGRSCNSAGTMSECWSHHKTETSLNFEVTHKIKMWNMSKSTYTYKNQTQVMKLF